MNFDPNYTGIQHLTAEDSECSGSRYSEVRDALFANAYYLTWGAADEPPLPVYEVTLRRALKGFFKYRKNWLFHHASDRIIKSAADMRWGPTGRGYRRILH